MRFLIISDIHANKEALDAVIEDAQGSYDQILCCGDLVGYGADPNYVVDWVRQNAVAVIRGNHDKAAAGLDDLEWFNPHARKAAIFSQGALTADNLDYLRNLPQGPLIYEDIELAHGSPVDEDEYVVTTLDIARAAPHISGEILFFGHTHLQGAFLAHRNGVLKSPRVGAATKLELQLDHDVRYMINPGSIGQPRDSDRRAAYAIYDSDLRLVTLARVNYDIATAQRKIIDAGLPELLANRLSGGT